MLSFNITNRFTGSILFTAEIEATEETPLRIKLGLAVRKAVSARAYLTDANLADANLAGANLAGAYLAGAYLAGAYLADANLADANLADANLADANLAGANLAGAYLAGAYLADANLAGANLAGANLAGGFKWRDGIVVKKAPIQISGLRWAVTILDDHMQIGCQFHSLSDWGSFDDRAIADMDGRNALTFWRTNKDMLLGLAKTNGRGVAAPVEEAA